MENSKTNYTVPVAILGAGALIAAALYFGAGTSNGTTVVDSTPEVPTVATPIAEVQADDHIKGDADAKVVIVEYSDTECPYCKGHHTTLQQLIDTYDSSEVAWVYRNFPIAQLHSKAFKQAEALECAAELGGNDGFWKYTDRLYELTPSNNKLDMALLPEIAEFAGLDVTAFNQCLESGDMAERVQADLDEVVAAGGRGTPHNIILVGGEQFPLGGAQSFDTMKQIIDQLLTQ